MELDYYIQHFSKEKKLVVLRDHCNGFDFQYNNEILSHLSQMYDNYSVMYHQIMPPDVKLNYSNLNIKFDLDNQEYLNLNKFSQYQAAVTNKTFNNFICSFLGSGHISRQFLSSILHKTKLWNNNTCTKNFVYSKDKLDGSVNQYVSGDSEKLYINFFRNDDNFNEQIFSKNYAYCANVQNLANVEQTMSGCFVTLVSETLGTSYVPFITEKFLESIVTKNLFVAYAQPNWHDAIESQYGFKLYRKIFDYEFDKISNPVYRVVRLVEMISKFQHLSSSDWHDLYLLEKDSIEYNYDHYYSKSYLKNLAKFA